MVASWSTPIILEARSLSASVLRDSLRGLETDSTLYTHKVLLLRSKNERSRLAPQRLYLRSHIQRQLKATLEN